MADFLQLLENICKYIEHEHSDKYIPWIEVFSFDSILETKLHWAKLIHFIHNSKSKTFIV